MQHDFFVMLHTQSGGITPMVDSAGEELATCETKERAEDGAKGSVLGDAFGYGA